MPVAESHKELRFTRARQGAGFAVAAGMLAMTALVFFLLAPYRADNPELPHPAWGLLPLAVALASGWTAARCIRHAYLLLSPIGIEIFPFFRPSTGLNVIPWAQIAAVEIDDSRLTLHFTAEKTAGVHLALAPIPRDKRRLLIAAMEGRFSK
ncbi:hypothetical protein KBB96_18240 [Luteolibacter ambystomatis]|uniref:Uncharacterized protein n=1 Tax=Luteolibacter ambystomatis TaxID=2824561 RepID=A0A975IZD0_9BACT|nr:hypothetical protein [Luteolibacter ambystomatis]QUE50788.1 hypothetical protein KBB96_18240 [Luteolibacter ambystomatis]